MAEITGSFEAALEECSRVLAVRGRVLPSTLENVTLCAELADGRVVRGESVLAHSGSPIERVYLDPPSPTGHPDAVRAILEADAVIVGPGSLYTSVLPNLLVADVGWALAKTKAKRVYVCNVATEEGETSGFAVADFVRVLEAHLGSFPIDCVLANQNYRVGARRGRPVALGWPDPRRRAGGDRSMRGPLGLSRLRSRARRSSRST
jgi:uncharacterized cofD-like protein